METAEAEPLTPDLVNAALSAWRQGDCVVGKEWFILRTNKTCPLTDLSKQAASKGLDLVEKSTLGLAVVSQTCDIARRCLEQPYIAVSPLIQFSDPVEFNAIVRGRRPRFVHIPGLMKQQLVADLAQCQTVEKSVVATWVRVPGCIDEVQSRVLGRALGRHRSRTPFPDDFNAIFEGLKKRIGDKHGKGSPEGQALESLLDIRVRALPDWNAPEVQIYFWFIRDENSIADVIWHEMLAKWLGYLAPTKKYENFDGAVVTLEDISAKDYYDSDPLDLDHLSTGQAAA